MSRPIYCFSDNRGNSDFEYNLYFYHSTNKDEAYTYHMSRRWVQNDPKTTLIWSCNMDENDPLPIRLRKVWTLTNEGLVLTRQDVKLAMEFIKERAISDLNDEAIRWSQINKSLKDLIKILDAPCES